MRNFSVFVYSWIVLLLLTINPVSFAQKPEAFNASEAPFLHSVASGDPTDSKVIIWTRLTVPLAPRVMGGLWEVSKTTDFKNIERKGEFNTSADRDYTVKVDVDGLEPNTWYYYRFKLNDTYSPIGRTRTMPKGNTDNIRIAVLSCQDYQNGYYNALEDIVNKNNVDIIFFLGDYIYEYGPSKKIDRPHEPRHDIVSLNDYRVRYSQYRLDAQLAEIHRQFPFICVWDDHETANDSYAGGAQNHNVKKQGDFKERLSGAQRVYFEWLPVRENTEALKIYRSFNWGNLAKFYFLDTRIAGRDEQIHRVFPSINDKNMNDTVRSLLGKDQWNWLESELKSSEGKWNFFAQQVMMAPLLYNIFESYKVLNPDQWDGYPLDRERMRLLWKKYTTPNPVVLTGDIHTSWANELPGPNYNPADGSNSMGVEFVGTSVTSENAINLPGVRAELKYMNPHMKFIDLEHHGYFTVDIRKDSIITDFYFVNTIKSRTYKSYRAIGFVVRSGESRLIEAKDTTAVFNRFPSLAPGKKDFIKEGPEIQILNISGNQRGKKSNVWLYSTKYQLVQVKLLDKDGNLIYEQYGRIHNGFNEMVFKEKMDMSLIQKVEVRSAEKSSNPPVFVLEIK